MKYYAPILFFSLILLLSQSAQAANTKFVYSGPIASGGGYSDDSQQIAPVTCFNATTQLPTSGETVLHYSSAESFSQFENDVHVNVSASGGYAMFSASAEADYMRDVQNTDYSFSLNYYEYSHGTVSVQPNIANPLNSNGEAEYKNNYTYFGTVCGDKYISSYQEGAKLLMSLNLQFSSAYEKQKFEEEAGASFGDIFSASEQIQKIATEYNIQGSVDIQAYQEGGEPSQLSQILSPVNGEYPVLSCTLQKMQDCTKAAQSLLSYASNSFSKQFSYSPAKNLKPLGLGFTQLTNIEEIGLKPPPTLVTSTIAANRTYLADTLQEYQYYQQKFYALLNSYPVVWDTQSSIYQTSKTLYGDANDDVNKIMNSDNPDNGALACYDDLSPNPNDSTSCINVTNRIKSYVTQHSIVAANLSYLTPMKYYVTGLNGSSDPDQAFYYNGVQFVSYDPQNIIRSVDSSSWYLSDEKFTVSGMIESSNGGDQPYTYNGKSTDGITYVGTLSLPEANKTYDRNAYRYISPYYFNAYTATAG
ncbi:MAG: hypothetical protein AAGA27_08630 [Pseudomonadota bacterium]